MHNPSPLLEIKDLHVTYGGIKAVRGISFSVREGEILTLIGANGAGKTSVLKAVSGVIPYRGEIRFDGRCLDKLPPHRIAALGIAHVPEGRGIFGNLTVDENLALAAWHRKDAAKVKLDTERILERFPRLGRRDSFAKCAAAFFKMSRSIFTSASSRFSQAISISLSLNTRCVLPASKSFPALNALTQLPMVVEDTDNRRPTYGIDSPPSTISFTDSCLNSFVYFPYGSRFIRHLH